MKVNPAKAAATVQHDGATYFFCSKSCASKFSANPGQFLSAAPAAKPPLPASAGTSAYICPMDPEVRQTHPGTCPKCGMALEPETIAPISERTEYTCPMHPEIVRDATGDCPICGMALEPRTVTVEAANPEHKTCSAASGSVPPSRFRCSPSWFPIYCRAIPSSIFSPALSSAGSSSSSPLPSCSGRLAVLRVRLGLHRFPHLNMFTLIAIGSAAAYLYSVAAVLFPQIFPAAFRDSMAIMVGTGRGAHEGVLIRNAEAFETLEKVDTLLVDKTGTLTVGKPRVTEIIAQPALTESAVLEIAAALEKASEHPLAAAILAAASKRGVAIPSVDSFESVTGQGAIGRLNKQSVAIGNAALMQNASISVDSVNTAAEALRKDGQTVMYVAQNNALAGIIFVSDAIKDTAAEAIHDLQRDGLRIIMLPGDNSVTAAAVAAKLAQAHVGIEMGTGTDIAMETGGITLVKGDLRGIVKARRLSRRTMRNIRQNLFFAFIYNALGVPLGAGVLYPVFGLLLSPMVAAAAMGFSSVSVSENALRLRSAML